MSFIDPSFANGTYKINNFGKKSIKKKVKASWDMFLGERLLVINEETGDGSPANPPVLNGFFKISKRNKLDFFIDDGDNKFRKKKDFLAYSDKITTSTDFLKTSRQGIFSVSYSELASVDQDGELANLDTAYSFSLSNQVEDSFLAFDIDGDMASRLSQLLDDKKTAAENDLKLVPVFPWVADHAAHPGEVILDIRETSIGKDLNQKAAITYTITSGNEEDLFSVNSDNAAIYLSPGSSLRKHLGKTKSLTLTASDGTENAIAFIEIEVGSGTSKINKTDAIPENTTPGEVIFDAKTILNTDNLSKGSEKTYKITAGDHRNVFAIDAKTGLISISKFNEDGFYQPKFLDAETDSCIDLAITVDDGENLDRARLQFSVKDEQEVHKIGAIGNDGEISPDHDSLPNHVIGSQISLTDSDAIAPGANTQIQGDYVIAHLDEGRTVQFGFTDNGSIPKSDLIIDSIHNDFLEVALDPDSNFVTFTPPYSGRYYVSIKSTVPGTYQLGVSGDGQPHQGFADTSFCDFIL